MIDILWIVLSTLTYVITLEINECNKTIDIRQMEDDIEGESKVSFKYDISQGQHPGKPYDCWYKLQAGDKQYVIIDVTALSAGEYKDEQCQEGYLRISEGDVPQVSKHTLPPTTMCGDTDPIRVKRFTRGSSAFVEFHMDRSDQSQNYEFDAMFIDKDPQDSLPYGHIQRTDGFINSSKCDWLVPADTCIGGCRVVSPGHPGIYPPNMHCHYTFMNFQQGRVQLVFGGRYKFDLKKSEDCVKDHVTVYDGESNTDPLIGRYCGLDSASIISTGPTLFMEFHSQAGGPPYDYSGFELHVVDRWKNEHEFGRNNPDTVCDWSFTSCDSVDGDLHTVDHMIKPGTTCLYTFTGEPTEVLEITVKSFALQPDCDESIEVFDGGKLLDSICADRLTKKSRLRGTSFVFNIDHHRAIVRYHSKSGLVSNSNPSWIYYTFRNATQDQVERVHGKKQPNSVCDWSFTSRDYVNGDLHTPDHMIEADTTCEYSFTGQPGEILEVVVRAFELQPTCGEYIELYDGEKMLDKICADRISQDAGCSRGTSFTFTTLTTYHQAVVRYYSKDGRLSNTRPSWIYYTFKNATNDPDFPETAHSLDQDMDDDRTSGTMVSQNVMIQWEALMVLSVALSILRAS